MVRIFSFGVACVLLCVVVRTIINVPLHVDSEKLGICADVNTSEIAASLKQTLDLTDVRCYPDPDNASLLKCPLRPLRMTVKDTNSSGFADGDVAWYSLDEFEEPSLKQWIVSSETFDERELVRYRQNLTKEVDMTLQDKVNLIFRCSIDKKSGGNLNLTNLTNTEDEYSEFENDHVTTGASTEDVVSSVVDYIVDL
ncbi:uncharacterized protein [Apostichopus japonicus]|uniref:uncharacterized protein n=1 Tax=Stichopus japonicus TaxID=307972 RepID=UPI003AB25B55